MDLIQMLLPNHFEAVDLRVMAHKSFVFHTIYGQPLAFYKQMLFQILERNSDTSNQRHWRYYDLESKSPTDSVFDASRDLRVIYLSEPLMLAWKYSASKSSAEQTEADWFLQ